MTRNQMTSIKKATFNDVNLLASLSVEAFLPAHGHSSPEKDINIYLEANFSVQNFKKEIANPTFEYYLIYHHNKIAGFSKIIFNTPSAHIVGDTITKMERLYLLEEFYGLHLGTELFNFNIKISKENKQVGIWLAVWIENKRGIKFYSKMGFKIVGKYDFKISETHSNPNHILYLEF